MLKDEGEFVGEGEGPSAVTDDFVGKGEGPCAVTDMLLSLPRHAPWLRAAPLRPGTAGVTTTAGTAERPRCGQGSAPDIDIE